MKEFFSIQRMLSIAQFHYYTYTGISAKLLICEDCLPIVVSHGFSFKEQCGDDTLFGHVFVSNEMMQDHTFRPRSFHNYCANCETRNQTCWELDIRLSSLEYLSDQKRATRLFTNWNSTEVTILGKRGHVVKSVGLDFQRPWITTYTIEFEDGTRFDAYRWQFQTVNKS